MARNCPLCLVDDEAFHTAVWRAYAERLDAEAAAGVAGALTLEPISAKLVRDHFAYHEPVQPAPPGNLKRGKALEAVERLSDRQRQILRIVARQGCVSEQQIIDVLYAGRMANQNTAQAAGYRDLRRLVYADLLYRAYPPHGGGFAARPGARRTRPAILHLGRDAVPYIEEQEGFTPKPVTGAAQIDWHKTRLQHARAGVYASLSRQLAAATVDEPLRFLDHPAGTNLDPASWYGPAQSAIYGHNPLTGAGETFRPGGLAALRLVVPQRGISTLLPFFYEHDAGLDEADVLVDRLLVLAGVKLSGLVAQRFPDIAGLTPPLVLVCSEAARIGELRRCLQRRRKAFDGVEPPAVIVLDSATLQRHAVTGEVWTSLWDMQPQPRRLRLLDALALAQRAVFQHPTLHAETPLSLRLDAARKPKV